ncbi:MAG: hypothetical protein AB1649_17640 [Chloroflexota bacterium]
MRCLPFRLMVGLMIAAILILTLVAAGLALAIFDEEVAAHRTETSWPTATIDQQAIVTLWRRSETPTNEITVMPSTTSPDLPTGLPPNQEGIPSKHPTAAPNSACSECHQFIGEGGG